MFSLDTHAQKFPVVRNFGGSEAASVQHVPVINDENIPRPPVHRGKADLCCAMRNQLGGGFAFRALRHHAAGVKPDEHSGRAANGRVERTSAIPHKKGSGFKPRALRSRDLQVTKSDQCRGDRGYA